MVSEPCFSNDVQSLEIIFICFIIYFFIISDPNLKSIQCFVCKKVMKILAKILKKRPTRVILKAF